MFLHLQSWLADALIQLYLSSLRSINSPFLMTHWSPSFLLSHSPSLSLSCFFLGYIRTYCNSFKKLVISVHYFLIYLLSSHLPQFHFLSLRVTTAKQLPWIWERWTADCPNANYACAMLLLILIVMLQVALLGMAQGYYNQGWSNRIGEIEENVHAVSAH